MDESIKEKANHKNLKERFDKFHERSLGKDASKSIDWIKFIQFELDGLRVKRQTHLKKIDSKTNNHDKKHDWKCCLGKNGHDANENTDNIFCINGLIDVAEDVRCIVCYRKINTVPQELQ